MERMLRHRLSEARASGDALRTQVTFLEKCIRENGPYPETVRKKYVNPLASKQSAVMTRDAVPCTCALHVQPYGQEEKKAPAIEKPAVQPTMDRRESLVLTHAHYAAFADLTGERERLFRLIHALDQDPESIRLHEGLRERIKGEIARAVRLRLL